MEVRYVARDGMSFDSSDACLAYEEDLDRLIALEAINIEKANAATAFIEETLIYGDCPFPEMLFSPRGESEVHWHYIKDREAFEKLVEAYDLSEEYSGDEPPEINEMWAPESYPAIVCLCEEDDIYNWPFSLNHEIEATREHLENLLDFKAKNLDQEVE